MIIVDGELNITVTLPFTLYFVVSLLIVDFCLNAAVSSSLQSHKVNVTTKPQVYNGNQMKTGRHTTFQV